MSTPSPKASRFGGDEDRVATGVEEGKGGEKKGREGGRGRTGREEERLGKARGVSCGFERLAFDVTS